MRVLALDTTTREGSLALVEGSRVIVERSGDPSRTHAERLPRDIQLLLEKRGLASSDVDVFAVAAGPGSFTGLRIGIATIQGLSFVHGRRVAVVPALEAMAQIAGRAVSGGALVGAWMDAGRGEVYSALYRLSAHPPFDSRRLIETDAPAVGGPATTLSRWRDLVGEAAVAFVGSGAVTYADLISARDREARIFSPTALAGAVGLLAVSRAALGETVEPASVRPLYVRRPDAELDRDRRTERKR